jgi:hypothetical protein
LWKKLDDKIQTKQVISVREARFELERRFTAPLIKQLENLNADFFEGPDENELAFVKEIYLVGHFRQNLDRKKSLQGGAFADPFIVAKAKTKKGVVVTEEERPAHGARIPNICEHFHVECLKLEGFLTRENWTF